MADITGKDTKILINHLLVFKLSAKPLKKKPDACLVIRERAVAFFDLKMDLGYKRKTFFLECRKNDKKILKMRGHSFTTKDGLTKKPMSFSVDKRCKHHVVVISSENISSKELQAIQSQFNGLKASSLYLLTEGIPPNEYHRTVSETVSDITIRKNEFMQLKMAVRKMGV